MFTLLYHGLKIPKVKGQGHKVKKNGISCIIAYFLIAGWFLTNGHKGERPRVRVKGILGHVWTITVYMSPKIN